MPGSDNPSKSPEGDRDLELEMYKCQNQIYKDMHKLTRDVHKTVERVALLEQGHAEIKATLADHEVQRRTMHEKLENKMDLLLEHVAGVKAETDANSDFIDTLKKYWMRITLISTGVVSTLAGGYWLYTFLQKHGFIIVLAKSAS